MPLPMQGWRRGWLPAGWPEHITPGSDLARRAVIRSGKRSADGISWDGRGKPPIPNRIQPGWRGKTAKAGVIPGLLPARERKSGASRAHSVESENALHNCISPAIRPVSLKSDLYLDPHARVNPTSGFRDRRVIHKMLFRTTVQHKIDGSNPARPIFSRCHPRFPMASTSHRADGWEDQEGRT